MNDWILLQCLNEVRSRCGLAPMGVFELDTSAIGHTRETLAHWGDACGVPSMILVYITALHSYAAERAAAMVPRTAAAILDEIDRLPLAVGVLMPRPVGGGLQFAAVRSEAHGGLITTPGGKIEREDRDVVQAAGVRSLSGSHRDLLLQAARREVGEELGLSSPRARMRLVGPVFEGICGGFQASVVLMEPVESIAARGSEGETCWATREQIEHGQWGAFYRLAFAALDLRNPGVATARADVATLTSKEPEPCR